MVLVKLVRRWWTLLAVIILKDDCSASLTVKVPPFLELFAAKAGINILDAFWRRKSHRRTWIPQKIEKTVFQLHLSANSIKDGNHVHVLTI